MDTAKSRVPTARIEFRPTKEQKQLFEHAAALEGRTLTEFLLSSAEESASRIIREHEVLHLRGQFKSDFISALIHPPEPNEKLKVAFERYFNEVEAR